MKPFHEVQQARRAQSESHHNSVHRSSLLAPKMDRASTQVAFLNHFLIKRGIKAVTCKMSAIDDDGKLAGSATLPVDAPIVYTINLEAEFPELEHINQYVVEFFSHDNLVVPYPAIMINHIGEDFINVVHSYNRVLNDIFEDEQVNKISVMEASIDVVDDGRHTTFFTFCAGPLDPGGELEVLRSDNGVDTTSRLTMAPGRLACQTARLSDLALEGELKPSTVIKISQPRQRLFYGRMLAGVMNRQTGAFSANHSYYDTSEFPEYFDNDYSARTYPYFPEFLNSITIYPIMSPGLYDVQINLAGSDGSYSSEPRAIVSPGGAPVSISIDALATTAGLSDCSAFEVVVTARNGEKIPTRVMHQLVYGDRTGRSRLNSSVAVGLINRSVFRSTGKTGLCWGQMVLHRDYHSRTGICFDVAEGEPAEVSVQLYSGSGLFHEWSETLAPGYSLIFGNDSIPAPDEPAGCIWYVVRSSRPDVSAQSFHVHKISGNASGEHSF